MGSLTTKITNTATGIVGRPSATEAMESRGGVEMVNSSQLPVKIPPEDRAKLVEAGVVFLGMSHDDDLFMDVTLPKGWKKRKTDHNMWTELVDEFGQVVANIFYKAAPYDRRAELNLERNYVFAPPITTKAAGKRPNKKEIRRNVTK